MSSHPFRVALTAFALAFAPAFALAAESPQEVHGVSDAFAAPGVALAWAVARAQGAGDATVVLRVETDNARYPYAGMIGVDPFTRQTKAILAPAAIADRTDIAVPRAHFADFPRTELRLYASEPALRAGTAALVIYYLGVPDTTPEFAATAALESSLNDRIARARSAPAGKP